MGALDDLLVVTEHDSAIDRARRAPRARAARRAPGGDRRARRPARRDPRRRGASRGHHGRAGRDDRRRADVRAGGSRLGSRHGARGAARPLRGHPRPQRWRVKPRYPCSRLAPVPVFHSVTGSGSVDPVRPAAGVRELDRWHRPRTASSASVSTPKPCRFSVSRALRRPSIRLADGWQLEAGPRHAMTAAPASSVMRLA